MKSIFSNFIRPSSKRQISFVLFLFGYLCLPAQSEAVLKKMDSLENNLNIKTGLEWFENADELSYYWSIEQYNSKKAIELANESLKKLPPNHKNNLDYLKIKTRLLLNLANANSNLSNYLEAQQHLNECGQVNKLIAKFDEKIALYYEGRKSLENAEVYYHQGHFHQQIEELRLSARAFEKVEQYYDLAISFGNIGVAYRKLGQLDSSLYYLELCEPLMEKYHYPAYVGTQEQKGSLYFKMGKMEIADSLFRLTIEKGKEFGIKEVAWAKIGLADIALQKENYRTAIEWLDSALPEIESREAPMYLANVYETYAKGYEGLGNNEKSLSYYQKYMNLYNDLKKDLFDQDLLGLQNEMQIKEKNEKIRTLKYSIWKRNIINYTVWILLTIGAIIGGFWLRKYLREKQKPIIIDWSGISTDNHIQQDPFLEQFKKVLNERMGDPNLNVESLSKDMRMSRVQLFKKTKEHFSNSPSVLIRQARLEKAKKLLEKAELNISEVAYEVGFVNASHFARLFKKHFGHPPSKL